MIAAGVVGDRYDRLPSVLRLGLTSTFAVLAVALAGGCGGSSHATSTHATPAVGAPPPNVVSTQQIDAYPAGSPARALLEFWQAIQFSDVESARKLVAPSARQFASPRFTNMVQTIGDDIPGLKILNTRTDGANASVRVYLLFYASDRSVAASSPQSFALRRGASGYQLSDLSYFTHTEQTILAAKRRASRR